MLGIEPPSSPRSEELDVENLISDYVQQSQYGSLGEALRGIRVSDIIAAVDMESGNSKAGKKVKRKTGRTKGAIKRNNQPPAKKAKNRCVLTSMSLRTWLYHRSAFVSKYFFTLKAPPSKFASRADTVSLFAFDFSRSC